MSEKQPDDSQGSDAASCLYPLLLGFAWLGAILVVSTFTAVLWRGGGDLTGAANKLGARGVGFLLVILIAVLSWPAVRIWDRIVVWQIRRRQRRWREEQRSR